MHYACILTAIVSLFYLSMVVAFTVGIAKASYKLKQLEEPKVSISIVLALRNEEKNVDTVLKSIFNQDYPSKLYEVVLVNDHSTDNTLSKINDVVAGIDNVSIINLPNYMKGKKQAIAMGVASSKYDLIVLTDADCVHPTTWLSSIASRYDETNASLIIGPVMVAPSGSMFQNFQALEHASLTASGLGASTLGSPIMASSANLSFSKSELGFNVDLMNPEQPSGDDVFLLHNVKRLKKKISFIHDQRSLVTTKPSKTVKEFFSQRSRWASKASAYNDFASIAVAAIVLLFNLLIVGLFIGALFFSPLWVLVFVLMFIKLIVDLPLLWIFLNRYRAKSLLTIYLPLQLIYPFYILIAFLLSLLVKTEWRGRVVNK